MFRKKENKQNKENNVFLCMYDNGDVMCFCCCCYCFVFFDGHIVAKFVSNHQAKNKILFNDFNRVAYH